MSGRYEFARGRGEQKKRDSKFYKDLAEDARMLAARLQGKEARSVISDVAAAFIAARLEKEAQDQAAACLGT